MLKVVDTDKEIPEITPHICEYHKLHPTQQYAGCTCVLKISTRIATPLEYKYRKQDRLSKRKRDIEHELSYINKELEDMQW